MAEYLKRAEAEPEVEDRKTRAIVEDMLARIRAEGEEAVRGYAEELDGWTGDGAAVGGSFRRGCCGLSDIWGLRLVGGGAEWTRDFASCSEPGRPAATSGPGDRSCWRAFDSAS